MKKLLLASIIFSISAFASEVGAKGEQPNGEECTLKISRDLDKNWVTLNAQKGDVVFFNETFLVTSQYRGVLVPKGGADISLNEKGNYKVDSKTGDVVARVIWQPATVFGFLFSQSASLQLKNFNQDNIPGSYVVKHSEFGEYSCNGLLVE